MKLLLDTICWKDGTSNRGLLVSRENEYFLCDELVEWFCCHVNEENWKSISWFPRADLESSSVHYWIEIEDPDLALLFKLAWGGL